MKKQYSLKSNIEFGKILSKGKNFANKHLIVNYQDADEFKLGISVPKKLGNAVFRNYNKRVVKEIIPKLEVYDIKKHIVIIVRQAFIDLPMSEKQIVLENTFNKLINGK